MSLVNYSSQNTRFCLELDRIKLLLQKLGNPEKDFRIIHVAGTNGKGSICSFIETGLISMGIRTGCFVSPELLVPEDSVRIDGTTIDSDKLEKALSYVSKASAQVENELGKAPSKFELLFAAALVHFCHEKCHTVILECGMGGIGDATNSIDHNDISVFAGISIDHADYLGNSIKQIAENKCGIIRKNTYIVSADQAPDAEKVIIDKCKKEHCQLKFAKKLKINRMEGLNAVVNLPFGELKLSLAGTHQAQNAAVAVHVLSILGAEDKDIAYALTKAVHKARLEEIKPGIYFDGAHNPDGVEAMADSINRAQLADKINFAVGFMADKDIDGCLEKLQAIKAKNIEIFTTPVHSNPRSETAETLRNIAINKGFKATACKDVRQAIKMAKRSGGVVFVFGSLYMYKEL